jgi:hypothetical protein
MERFFRAEKRRRIKNAEYKRKKQARYPRVLKMTASIWYTAKIQSRRAKFVQPKTICRRRPLNEAAEKNLLVILFVAALSLFTAVRADAAGTLEDITKRCSGKTPRRSTS